MVPLILINAMLNSFHLYCAIKTGSFPSCAQKSADIFNYSYATLTPKFWS